MKITRRIHLNPQSKGSLGKSFETEFRVAWLRWLEIPWDGSDLDDRHHTFQDRHPQVVKSYRLGNQQDSKATLLNLFRRIPTLAAPVHVIDCRAQADELILQTLDELQILDSLAEVGVKFTFLLFPSEDTESMNNLMDLFEFAGDRVDYLIVHNPAKVRTDLFTKSGLESELLQFGAKIVTLPSITPVTLLAIKRAEAKIGRKLSFGELVQSGASHLERMLAGEMQWAMQRMFPQYLAAAKELLPTDLIPSQGVDTTIEPPTRVPRQRHLNLGE
jgi:hypothetical protein